MRKELKDRWIAALRSDKFPQTTCALHTQEGYCCLGVAAAIFAEELGIEVKELEAPEALQACTTYDGIADVLLEKLSKLLEMPVDGTLPTPVSLEGWTYPFKNLMALNDDARFTFKQIADIIDEQF